MEMEEIGGEEKTTEDWEEFVRSEVEALLSNILPLSVKGGVGIQYKNLIKEELESGPVYDDTKAVGVDILLSFDFGEEIDKPV